MQTPGCLSKLLAKKCCLLANLLELSGQFSKHPSTFITACITRTYFRLHNIRSDLYLHSKHFCDSICLEDLISKGRLMSDLGLCAALATATLDTKVIRKMWYKLFFFSLPPLSQFIFKFLWFHSETWSTHYIRWVHELCKLEFLLKRAWLDWLCTSWIFWQAGAKKRSVVSSKKSCVLPKYCL